ncbi:hypothetical protein MFMK1_003357 [Metallumcola ferriviriculae]|uniref:Uncharacterized protein n=1 Tax=Metallumcola ferriviriculae TaxID=3039180 RepID=A0AAU0UUA2_9FIRM|nr:hypothetical protein MFMK1_003357 [Desulfitibacteraceae bacterium MK1]
MTRKFIAILITVALMIIVGSGIHVQNTYALQKQKEQTIKEFFTPIGSFMKENKNYLSQSISSLRADNLKVEEIIARVNAWPITMGELEFRRGLRDISGLGSSEYTDVFNVLVEEKIIIDYSLKNGILPSKEQIQELIEREKGWYQDSNGQYKETVDAILRASNMTLNEYWTTYEWYNAFRLLAFDNTYKFVIKNGQKQGKLPSGENGITEEMIKQYETYWNNHKKSLKAKAEVKMLDDKGLNLELDLEKLFL